MNKIENFVNANKELKNKTNPTDLTSKSVNIISKCITFYYNLIYKYLK